VTRKRFCEHLKRERSDLTESQIKRLMSKPGHLIRRHLRDTYLAPYAMWATFSEADPSGDPFTALPDHARGIRMRLGLDANDHGDMVLLDYSLPAGTEPLYPTIADAYAGQLWPAQFRPARDSDTCGRTMPLPDDPDARPQPEVIHRRITGATLEAPIRIAKETSAWVL
jgi:hypothetical protein